MFIKSIYYISKKFFPRVNSKILKSSIINTTTTTTTSNTTNHETIDNNTTKSENNYVNNDDKELNDNKIKKKFYFKKDKKTKNSITKADEELFIKRKKDNLLSKIKDPNATVSSKEFQEYLTLTSTVRYDKSKKDFPLLFSSDDENDYFQIPISDSIERDYEDRIVDLTKKAHKLDIDKLNLTTYETILDFPKYIQTASKKIFSKYKLDDIREWSKKYLLLYSQNHAVEAPLDLSKLKKIPLGNSDELDINTKYFKSLEKDINKSLDNEDTVENNNIDNLTTGTTEYEGFIKSYFKNKSGSKINPLLRIDYTPPFAVAYLYCRFPYTFNTIRRILSEVKKRNPSFKPESILDYGAGLGSGILAVFDVYNNIKFKKVAAIEPNKYMRKLGKYVTDTSITNALSENHVNKSKESFSLEPMWVDSLSMLPGTGGLERGKYDIVILSHVLQEVITSKAREMILETLFSRLSDKGILIVVEPGSPKGFRFINDIREWVREKIVEQKKQIKEYNKMIEQYKLNKSIDLDTKEINIDLNELSKYKIEESDLLNIISPCPQSTLMCPLASNSNSWCHFSQLSSKYSKSIFSRIKQERDIINEKFSYLVIKKGKHVLNSIDGYEIYNKDIEYTEDTGQDLNDYNMTNDEMSYKWSRLVRPIIKKEQHVIVDICNKKGQIERRILSKAMGIEGGYKVARKAKWGDLWMYDKWIPNKFRKEQFKGKRLW